MFSYVLGVIVLFLIFLRQVCHFEYCKTVINFILKLYFNMIALKPEKCPGSCYKHIPKKQYLMN